MKVTPVKAFVRHIAPMLEKCPSFVIEREVVKVVGDICRSTGCITTTSSFDTASGSYVYEIPVPSGFDLEQIRYAYCDGAAMRPMTYDEINGVLPFDVRETHGKPLVYSFRQHEQMSVFPIPDAKYTIKVDVTVALRLDAKVVPEMFFMAYLDLVTYGVLYRVCQFAGQPYTNLQLAAAYYQQYQSALSELKAEVFRDYTRTAGRVRFNRIV